jgi:uncharacterized membrane protein
MVHGYWLLVIVYWLMVIVYWLMVIVYWLLVNVSERSEFNVDTPYRACSRSTELKPAWLCARLIAAFNV